MRLEERNVFVDAIEFGTKTCVRNHVLVINRQELITLLKQDPMLSEVKIEIASPGESCRIVRVMDVVEPRIKVNSSGQVFPGMTNPLDRVGSGQTICLKGVAVVETWQMRHEIVMLIDMSGPAAELSNYSHTHNVVLIPKPAEGVTPVEYSIALKNASLRTAQYLADASKEVEPDEVTTYELGHGDRFDHLPRVAYICQLFSLRPMAEPAVYGHNAYNMLPSIMHPNEFFDGAIVSNHYDNPMISDATYSYQNHPVIRELYRKHGRELDFVGVILKDAPDRLVDKDRSALMTANLAKWTLQVDGVILSKDGGGHPQLDLSLTCQRCEELGIKTVLMLVEFHGVISGETIIFNSRTADAIVTSGIREPIAISPMKRVIGDEFGAPDRYAVIESAYRGGSILNWYVRGLSQHGGTRSTSVEY